MHGTRLPKRRAAKPRRSLGRRLARIALGIVLVLVLLPPVLVGGLLVALRFDAPRAFAAKKVDAALATLFRGRIHLSALERVDLGGVRVSGSVDDPAGRTVLRFQSVTVNASVPALLVAVIRGGGTPGRIDFAEVQVPNVEVALVDSGDGTPTLAHTFDPRTPSPTKSSSPPPTIVIRQIRLEHAWIHGAMASSPLIDAELARARAALGLESNLFHVELSESRLVTRLEPYALNPHGKLTGALRVPLGAGALGVRAAFSGVVAEAQATATATLDGQALVADAELPAVTERQIQRFVPSLTLRGSLGVSAHARGALDALELSLQAQGEAGELTAKGQLSTVPALRVNATLSGKRWDASALVPSAPATRLDVESALTLALGDGVTMGNYDVALRRAELGGEAMPDVTTTGTFRLAGSRTVVDGDVRAQEPGIDADATYALRLSGEQGNVEVGLRATLRDPPRLRRLAGVQARGTAAVRAQLRLPEATIGAVADARFDEVRRESDRLGSTHVHLEASGPSSRPNLRASVLVAGAHVQGRDVRELVAGLDGNASRAHVELAVSTPAHERLVLASEVGRSGDEVVLEGTRGRLRDGHGGLELEVARTKIVGGRLTVDGLEVHGAGDLKGSFALEGPKWRVAARTDRLDLARLARMAHISIPLKRARATLDVELARTASIEGSVRGGIDGISYAHVDDGKVLLALEGRGKTWSGSIATELVPGARFNLVLVDFYAERLTQPDMPLPEGGLHAEGTLDLTSMSPLFASLRAVPVEEAKGRIDLEVDYRRESLAVLPALTGRVRTHDLEVVEKREPRAAIESSEEAIQAAPSSYRGIDFGIDFALDAPSRRLTAHLGVYDDRAELLMVDAAAGPWSNGSPAALAAKLSEIPLEVRATMPARRLAQLPPMIRPASLRGTAAGDLSFDGTIAEPHVVVDVRGSRLTAATGARVQGETKSRIAVIGRAEYRRQGGEVIVVADAKRARALDAKIRWSGDALRAATDSAARDAFTVNGQVTIDRFDLETIPALKNRQIEGIVSGALNIEYGSQKRRLFASLVGHPLRAGQATYDQLNVSVDAAPGHLRGAVDVRGQGGSLQANVTSGLSWPARGIPAIDGNTVARLSAHRLRLGGLWPLVSRQVNELDGRLDAELGARVEDAKVTLTGSGRLTDGLVQIPTIGQRLEAISARIAVQPSAIVVNDLRANGLTGQLKGQARVEVDEHLALRRLDTEIAIEKSQKLPITMEGVAIGDAWGRVQATVVNEPERVAVRVVVPELHVDVPDTDREGVQELAPDTSIRVGVHRADAVFAALPIQPIEEPRTNPTPTDVNVELGSVWVKKGDMVNAELTGAIHVAARAETVVTGRIDLKGGSLDVQGKRFEIERGTVTFTGDDPSNPTVSAEARWEAPAGYVVTASYTGTARKGKLTLSAEPQLSQEEIVNLILFGTPEGSVSSGSGNTAAGAVGLAGGTAAKGINRAVSDLTNLDIQARVDTSTGTARPELMIPVTRRLSARVTRAIGEPPPGSSPDRTFLTLELRLKRNWALSALLGDRGASALDLVWRKHY